MEVYEAKIIQLKHCKSEKPNVMFECYVKIATFNGFLRFFFHYYLSI